MLLTVEASSAEAYRLFEDLYARRTTDGLAASSGGKNLLTVKCTSVPGTIQSTYNNSAGSQTVLDEIKHF